MGKYKLDFWIDTDGKEKEIEERILKSVKSGLIDRWSRFKSSSGRTYNFHVILTAPRTQEEILAIRKRLGDDLGRIRFDKARKPHKRDIIFFAKRDDRKKIRCGKLKRRIKFWNWIRKL